MSEFNYKFQIGEKAWVNCFNRPTQVEIISMSDVRYWQDEYYTVKAIGKEDYESFLAKEDRLAKTKAELCDKYIAITKKRVDYLKDEIAKKDEIIKKWEAFKEEE